jgi:membrane associated rhomboid family serine protease
MLIPIGTEERLPRQRLPLVTAALVLINVAVFTYQVMVLGTSGEAGLAALIADFGVVPAHFTAGQWINPDLISAMFMHAGLLHLASNMLFLAAFGDNIEDRLGPVGYLLVYFGCGIAASLAHIAVNPASTVPSIGASGAIAGMLAAYLVFFPTGLVKALFFLGFFITVTRLPAILFIGFWFVTQLFSGLASLGAATAQGGGIAFWAHIGGFVAGFAVALVLRMARVGSRHALSD